MKKRVENGDQEDDEDEEEEEVATPKKKPTKTPDSSKRESAGNPRKEMAGDSELAESSKGAFSFSFLLHLS